ncbi:MAG: dynamin family protein [Planctomycetes bacterium]|nr:dynamin family protein [Planctomycetota bacterium]RIK71146.1 MAG: hypothetical protein DCC66_02990 [Planctomycetota bacterium]
MQLANNSASTGPVKWAHQVNEILRRSGEKNATDQIEKAITQHQEDRFLIAVLGKAKRGKSTLLNAILGRRDDLVAPIDKLPASSAITRFVWGEREAATVFFRDGRRQDIDLARIKEFVTEELNPANVKSVDVVEVTGPFPGMDKDLVLVDTPGAGSLHEYHDAILHAFIPQADAVIFLVTARMPLDQDELELLKNVKAADIGKVFFAVNRVDEAETNDIEAAVSHNQQLLSQVGIHVSQIHRISAKSAFQGTVSSSGLSELMREISSFLGRHKGRARDARLVARVSQAAEMPAQHLAAQLASSRKTVVELEAELSSLSESKRTIKQDREISEREFTHSWSRAVDSFEHQVKDAKSAAKMAVTSRIARTSLAGLGSVAKELPTIITRAIESELAAPAQTLEESLSASTRKLQVGYPSVEMQSTGEVSIRTKASHTTVLGGMAGAAAVATGIGLASAGSAAAAGIAAANAAAIAAATTTITVPSTIAGIGSLLSSWGLGGIGSAISALGTGTATAAAPVALTTTPLWVAVAGPVGWTLAGLGVLAVPFAWRASKHKQKDRLEEASREQVDDVFQRVLTARIPALRRMGESIIEEFRLRLDKQLRQIEETIVQFKDHRPDSEKVMLIEKLNNELRDALATAPRFEAQTSG